MRIVGLAALLMGSAAMAQVPAGETAPAKKAAVAKEDKVVCRTTPEIGSLIATNKVCKTRREWTQTNEDLRMRGPVGNCAGGGGPGGGSCQY